MIYFRRDIQRLNDQWTTALAQQQERHDAEMQRLTARFDAERDRWRSDRADELVRVASPHEPYIAHLLATIEYERAYAMAERQRAEVAIDQCRVTHMNIGQVSMPTRDIRPQEVDREISRLMSDPGLVTMGSVEGLG